MPIKVRSWNGAALSRRIASAQADALYTAAEHVLEVANGRAPIEEGTLIRSGATDVDAWDGIASISYDTPYAVRLHENPQYRFQHGREGKWLERTLNDERGTVERLLADATEAGFR